MPSDKFKPPRQHNSSIADEHPPSLNDTFASRQYLRSSLARDPWSDVVGVQSSHSEQDQPSAYAAINKKISELRSSTRSNKSANSAGSNKSNKSSSSETNEATNPLKKCTPKRQGRRSRQELNASMLDMPHSSMIGVSTSMRRDIELIENDEHAVHFNGENDLHMYKDSTDATNCNAKLNRSNAIPSTQLLSNLGLDSSQRSEDYNLRSDSKYNHRSNSVFGAFWGSSVSVNDYDDESCESGAMTLIRSMGEVHYGEGKKSTCLLVRNAKRVLLCASLTLFVSMLGLAGLRVGRSNEHDINSTRFNMNGTSKVISGTESNQTSIIQPTNSDSDDNSVTTAQNDKTTATSNSGLLTNSSKETIGEKLALAEEVLRVCKPNGYDADVKKCQKFCKGRECCFVNDDKTAGSSPVKSNVTLEYCGDEPWKECLLFAGCELFFWSR
jgi:hypothetical protein